MESGDIPEVCQGLGFKNLTKLQADVFLIGTLITAQHTHNKNPKQSCTVKVSCICGCLIMYAQY